MACHNHDDDDCMHGIGLNIKHLVKIQSIFRGALLRKRLRALRSEYEDIFKELDDTELDVRWPDDSSLSLPIFEKKNKTSQSRSKCLQVKKMKESLKEKEGTEQMESCQSNEADVLISKNSNTSIQNPSRNDCMSTAGVEAVNLRTDTENLQPHQRTESRIPEQTCQLPVRDSGGLNNTGQDSGTHQPKPLSCHNDMVPEKLYASFDSTLTNVTQCEISKQNVTEQVFRDKRTSVRTSVPDPGLLHNSMHDNTSVWESEQSFQNVLAAAPSRQSLEQLRGQVAMELLWVQQAIQSRKQYLRMKGNI